MNFVKWPRYLTPGNLTRLLKRQKNPLTALQIFSAAKTRFANYRHNAPIYATMITLLGSCGHLKEMGDVIEQMKDDFCVSKDSMFADVFRIYGKFGMSNKALELFRRLREFNCVRRDESFATLLVMMVSEGELEIACRLYLTSSTFGVAPSTRCVNVLIGALCARNRSDLALQMFKEMPEQCCYPDRDTYLLLMKGLCRDGRLNDAIHLLYSMFRGLSTKGCGADVVVYRTLLETLCEEGMYHEANDVLGKVLKKGLKAPKGRRSGVDLTECTGLGGLQEAKAAINSVLVKRGAANSRGYSAMICDLLHVGRVEEADQLFVEMSERGLKPTLPVYNAKIDEWCREGKLVEAVCVLDQIASDGSLPNVETYNILMRGFCHGEKSKAAMSFLEKMVKQPGCDPDAESYGILIEGLCSEGLFSEAGEVLEKMVRRGFRPSNEAFIGLIRGLCTEGKSYDAVYFLEEMINHGKAPDSVVWNSLVTVVCSKEKEGNGCHF
ncbi:Pentatricopeptide repeat-containing protein [Nymphaea thermarum]|nr:Pentatricopeptide repeat-containing protein [Nymphaea thermarum]